MPTLDNELQKELKTKIRGLVCVPDHKQYEVLRRSWNYLFDKRPAAIIQCSGTADVITAVKFAKKNEVRISVRSGGHDYAGKNVSDESLLIDLSQMNAVRVDAEKRIAYVQPGATWGDVDHETQGFGLATPGATVSTVGVAGFVLGGGSGYLSRKYGMGCDNLISADIVTANGKRVHASKNENAELFWAIRGGLGNFGIVTSMELQLHEVGPEVMSAQVFYPFEDARNVLEFYRDFMKNAPDEVQCYAFIIPAPPSEPFPEEMHGKPIIALIACHAGKKEEGKKFFRALENFGNPVLSVVQSIPYTQMQQAFDDGVPKGSRWYSKAHDFEALTNDIIDDIIHYTRSFKGDYTMVYLGGSDGAINDVETEATAFPHRDTTFDFHILGGWDDADRDEEIMGWVQNFHHALDEHAGGGVYVNLLGHDEKQRVPHAYGANYERLQRIKQKWDPENLFSSNHNIPPAE